MGAEPKPSADKSVAEIEIPPVKNAAAQLAQFERRNDREHIEALAKDLYGMLEPSWFTEGHPVHLKDTKRKFQRQMKAGKYLEFLEAFRAYFMAKLRGEYRELALGDSELDLMEDAGRHWQRASDPKRLLNGYGVLPSFRLSSKHSPGLWFKVGPPGQVNWKHPIDDMRYWGTLWRLDAFSPLISEYIITKDPAYLKRWTEYADDWAIHQAGGFVDVNPFLTSYMFDNSPFAHRWVLTFFRQMAHVAATLPADGKGLPATTFARVLIRLLEEYPSLTVFYWRSVPQNWTAMHVPGVLKIGVLCHEFRLGRQYLRAARRLLEGYPYIHNLDDGTAHQQDPWYNFCYPAHAAYPSLELLKDHRPVWMTAQWENEVRDHIRLRSKWLIRVLTCDGEYPMGMRTDKRERWSTVYREIRKFSPESLLNPDHAAILNIAMKRPNSSAPAAITSCATDGNQTTTRPRCSARRVPVSPCSVATGPTTFSL